MESIATIATIGYEGATVADFLEALTAHGVELLVDIRAVASSRRPGFAKTALSANLEGAGIAYLHYRGLGTPADGRAAARSGKHDEMKRIFRAHLATQVAREQLHAVAELVHAGRRIALMCFEADAAHCHRSLVADALAAQFPLQVTNLMALDPFAE
ncbi:MAG: hypothetical protein JWM41_4296 [Gemmatimonadetes bacterium]|nr:hypothetical protein [Gemmatimonadota bacterium]